MCVVTPLDTPVKTAGQPRGLNPGLKIEIAIAHCKQSGAVCVLGEKKAYTHLLLYEGAADFCNGLSFLRVTRPRVALTLHQEIPRSPNTWVYLYQSDCVIVCARLALCKLPSRGTAGAISRLIPLTLSLEDHTRSFSNETFVQSHFASILNPMSSMNRTIIELLSEIRRWWSIGMLQKGGKFKHILKPKRSPLTSLLSLTPLHSNLVS